MQEFGFPFEPYQVQVQLMTAVRNAINNKQVGIFESPTGTGKSLSLICASLSWQSNFKGDKEEIEINDEEPDWVKQHQQKFSAVKILSPKKKKQRFQKTVDSDQTQIQKLLNMLEDQDSTEKKPKIFFCSRTHTQLSQTIGELKRTKYSNVKTASLGSRKTLCCNPAVIKLESATKINNKCQELLESQSCRFHKSEDDFFFDFKQLSLNKVNDIEELVDIGKKLQKCAYYGSRELIEDAEFITMPYNLLLQKDARESFGIDLTGAVVIIDEAHNLIDAINQMYSAEVDAQVLESGFKQLELYLTNYGSRLKASNASTLKQLMQMIDLIKQFLLKQSKQSMSISHFLQLAKIDHFNLITILEYAKTSELARKTQTEGSNTKIVHDIESFINALMNSDSDGRIVIDILENDRIVLKYLHLNPAIALDHVVQSARSVILTGGTMGDISDLRHQLFPSIPDSQFEHFSCGHVIPSDNLLATVCSSGPTNIPFRFTFETKQNSQMINESGLLLANLCNVVPDGVVCFFTSYQTIELFVQNWKSSQIMNRISLKKTVFIEQAGGSPDLLQKYTDAIKSREKSGAVLFAVIGGKLSEGINFADELGRLIVVFGVPYPNPESMEFKCSIEYHQRIFPESWKNYADTLCMKSVNQSIGRGIRHKNDYAAILLVDERYSQPKMLSLLPTWIKSSFKETELFKDVFSSIVKFKREMGLLIQGTPLSWEEAKKHSEYIREHGILQLLNIFKSMHGKDGFEPKWGDEIEYVVVSFDDLQRKVKLSLTGEELIEKLRAQGEAIWNPEFARYMVESTPLQPYTISVEDILSVEQNMCDRRKAANSLLPEGKQVLSLTTFPRLGCADFIAEKERFTNNLTKSFFIPDQVINKHPRFGALAKIIQERRGEWLEMLVPIYKDVNTASPFVQTFPNTGSMFSTPKDSITYKDNVFMDAMCFGMGCCCLQVTYQAANLANATTLHDQLSVFSSLMMALTAASPVQRGLLTTRDCRWNVIAASVDDRTPAERGIDGYVGPIIRKSRYSSIDSYISMDNEKYNDVPVLYHEKTFLTLIDNGVEEILARHFAILFMRDPLVVFKERLELNDEKDTDHFENIQSTNWRSMRFKPPPLNSPIGWRIEFRTMEVQPTDFENAAFSIFVTLLGRTILHFGHNFIIPISKAEQNIHRAHEMDAVLNQKFHFRPNPGNEISEECQEMSLDEIVNGCDSFQGLVSLIRKYLALQNCSEDELQRLEVYLDFVSARASGKCPTPAHWMRKFIVQQPEYKHDSIVSDGIAYDLLKLYSAISQSNQYVKE